MFGALVQYIKTQKKRLSPTSATKAQEQMFEILNGMIVAQAVGVLARLGVPDVLQDAELHYSALAEKVAADPESLYRLLRSLTAVGVLSESERGRFRLTPTGQLLCTKNKSSMRSMAIFQTSHQWPHWGELYASIKTGKPAVELARGLSFFEYIGQSPEAQKLFDDFMSGISLRETHAVLQVYDFGQYSEITDVGGGHGLFLSHILKAYPDLRGILYDQEQVISGAQQFLQAYSSRCRVVAGNFFQSVPTGSDLYVLKRVIHDWNNDQSMQILKAVRRSIPARGKLLLIETLIEENHNHFAKLLDIEMLTQGGRERTRQEYAELLSGCGFRLTQIVPAGAVSLIEAVPV